MTLISTVLNTMFSFYDGLFQPLLAMGPYVSLGFFSALLAGLFSVIYWWLLDIERADEIKEKLNKYQDKMSEARDNGNQDKASDHLKKTLELNQKFMMLNLKPMIATMVFVALFFPWLGATYAPTIQMNQTGNSTYTGSIDYAGQQSEVMVENKTGGLVISTEVSEAEMKGIIKAFGMDWQVINFKQVESENYDAELKINAEFVNLPVSLPLVGGALNWLGFYILIVMPLTYIFRKALGVQ